MRLAILTTDTLHHAFFVRELALSGYDVRVFCEAKGLEAPFEVRHPFEDRREKSEQEAWFDGNRASVSNFAETLTFDSMNDAEAVKSLGEFCADAAVVFGTGKLKRPIIDLLPGRLVNLHGGDPEEYRGLDTHLWAVYHRDFDGLISTLHMVSPELDTGDIIDRAQLPLFKGMKLEELRRVNTEACLEITCKALEALRREGAFSSTPQEKLGRYYSFMPMVLKEVCVRAFRKHTETIR